MPNYRREKITGVTYFIAQLIYQRIPWLCTGLGREAIAKVRQKYSLKINFIGCGHYQKAFTTRLEQQRNHRKTPKHLGRIKNKIVGCVSEA